MIVLKAQKKSLKVIVRDVFNIGSEEQVSINQMIKIIEEIGKL